MSHEKQNGVANYEVQSNRNINAQLPIELLLFILRDVIRGSSESMKSKAPILRVCQRWYRLGKPLLWEYALLKSSSFHSYGNSINCHRIQHQPEVPYKHVRSLSLVLQELGTTCCNGIHNIANLFATQFQELEFLSLNLSNLVHFTLMSNPTHLRDQSKNPLGIILQNLPPQCCSLELQLNAQIGAQWLLADMLNTKSRQLKRLRIEGEEGRLNEVIGKLKGFENLEELIVAASFEEDLKSSNYEPILAVGGSDFCRWFNSLHRAFTSGRFPRLRHGFAVSPNITSSHNERRVKRKTPGMRVLAYGNILTGEIKYCDMLALDRHVSSEKRIWTVFHNPPETSDLFENFAIRETTGRISQVLSEIESMSGASWQSNTNGTRLPTSYLASKEGSESGLIQQKADLSVTDLETEPLGAKGTALWTILHKNIGIMAPRIVSAADFANT